jgi:hypothetical protein
LAFGEVPGATIWIGGFTVFAAATYIAYRGSRDKAVGQAQAVPEMEAAPAQIAPEPTSTGAEQESLRTDVPTTPGKD